MAKTITVDPSQVAVMIGERLSEFPGVGTITTVERTDMLRRGSVFHIGSAGATSGDRVSVLLIDPGDRVRMRRTGDLSPCGDVRTVTHVAWALGLVLLSTSDGHVFRFAATGDGWPLVERVLEET